MRISARKGDPGYPGGSLAGVLVMLDGKRVNTVITADEEAGTVLRFKRDDGGSIVILDGGVIEEETLTGKVDVVLPPGLEWLRHQSKAVEVNAELIEGVIRQHPDVLGVLVTRTGEHIAIRNPEPVDGVEQHVAIVERNGVVVANVYKFRRPLAVPAAQTEQPL